MNNKFNLFKMIQENGAEADERIFDLKTKVYTKMFLLLKILFAISILLETLQLGTNLNSFKIVYYAFYFSIWFEPFVFSIKGLWESVGIAKLAVSAGCFVSITAAISILEGILPSTGIISICMFLVLSLFAGIASYFIYTISYYNYIKKQDIE